MPRIAIGDVELNHDRFGTGQPVLLICGTGQASSTKQLFQVPALVAEGYKAVTFDNRGIPPSDCPPAPWSFEKPDEVNRHLVEFFAAH
jgi:pimeloyl-ACP methyl ester carboxylesterase